MVLESRGPKSGRSSSNGPGAWNDGYEYRERIGPERAGRTVIAHLDRPLPPLGRDHLARPPRRRRDPGRRRRHDRGPTSCAPASPSSGAARPGASRRCPCAPPSCFRDAHLLAVAKPRGLPSIPHGGLYLRHTLLNVVRRRWPEASPMHRLGRGTSGLLLFARTPEARRAVAAAWREGRVEKSYRALVQGVPEREFILDRRAHRSRPPPPAGRGPRRDRVRQAVAQPRPTPRGPRRRGPRGGVHPHRPASPDPHPPGRRRASPRRRPPLRRRRTSRPTSPASPARAASGSTPTGSRLPHPVTGEPLELECPPPPILRD